MVSSLMDPVMFCPKYEFELSVRRPDSSGSFVGNLTKESQSILNVAMNGARDISHFASVDDDFCEVCEVGERPTDR